jgi:hypothetical protein
MALRARRVRPSRATATHPGRTADRRTNGAWSRGIAHGGVSVRSQFFNVLARGKFLEGP